MVHHASNSKNAASGPLTPLRMLISFDLDDADVRCVCDS